MNVGMLKTAMALRQFQL